MQSREVMRRILFISGVLMCCYGIIMSFLINFDFSLPLWQALGILLVLISVFCNTRRRRIFMRVIVAMICVATAFAVGIALYGCHDNSSYDEDAAIVLGCGIDGDTVSKQLAERLDAAADYYTANPNAVILVSGGLGSQEQITEALAMERYLIDKGVPSDRILKEEASTSTYTNLLYSKAILDDYFNGRYRSVIITSGYHIYRAADISKELGLNSSHIHGKTVWYELPIRYFREILAIIKNFFN